MPDLSRHGRRRGHLGPFSVLDCTLTASVKAEILEETGCSVAVRGRNQWEGRALTVCRPPSRLCEAKKLADAAIAASCKAKAQGPLMLTKPTVQRIDATATLKHSQTPKP